MAVAYSTYYGLTKVREQSPDAKDWAATDRNPELISVLMKFFEQHNHSGATAINFPGYGAVTNTLPTITEVTGGVLSPGVNIGVRLTYLTALGLETQGSPETTWTVTNAGTRPLTPQLTSTQAAAGALPGGTYIYAMTKKKASGETLISDVLPVQITYDTTYSVTLGFSAVNSYTDGTDAINIYRSTGLNAPFSLITSITTPSTATFTDTNTILPQNVNIQPPTTSTFDRNKKIRIDWSGLGAVPTGATAFRVYVTQQTGQWSTNHLLTEVDLTAATPPTFADYLGSETLASGWPPESSQIPASPPKINLSTQAIGAPTLTANMDFAGYQPLNMRLQNNAGAPATPTNGFIYYDTTISNVRAYINGAWVNWGITAGTGYTHPAEEAGGHLAANIKFITGSAVTAKTVFDTLRNADGTQKQLSKLTKIGGSGAALTTNSTSATGLSDMDLTGLLPNFNSQWAEAIFSGHFTHDTVYATLTVAIEYDGSTIEETVRSMTAGAISTSVSFTIPYLFQFGTTAAAKRVRVLWWVSAGTATSVAYRRSLTVKMLA